MAAAADSLHAPGSRRWTVDGVTFDVKALWNITVFRGRFDRVDGFYEVTPSGSRLQFAADARSIDTGDPARDEQLRSLRGVDWDAHPEVRFSSTSVRPAGDGRLHIAGRLEAAGRVLPIQFEAHAGQVSDGVELAGSWKVDERLLGNHGLLSVPATVDVRMHLR